MKLAVILASIALTVLPVQAPRAGEVPAAPAAKKTSKKVHAHGLVIRVADGGWGDAEAEEIETLLYAVAAEMLSHFPGRRIDPVIASHTRDAPIVLYERAPGGEYQVYLAAKDKRWAEFVYEFSHELCHVVANYEHHAPPRSARHQWFEEALCETASLYTLKRFSATWGASPPRPEWAAYALAMHEYTERMLNESHRRLPERSTLADWLRRNGPALRDNPYLRDRNEVVANQLLPLLEENPANWEAIGFLNVEVPDDNASFRDYLHQWYRRAPLQHRQFIRRTLSLLGEEVAPVGEGVEAASIPPPAPPPVTSATPQASTGAAGPAHRQR
jgi:hypothetical protein